MSKDGRIGNRAIIKALADFLQVEGVKRAPPDLNRDQVLAVVNLGDVQPYQVHTFLDLAFDIGGLNNYTRTIYDQGNDPILIGRDLRVLAVSLELSGPADAADTPMDLRLQYLNSSLPSICNYRIWEQTDSLAAWTRLWALGGATHDTFLNQGQSGSGWNGFVPGIVFPSVSNAGIELIVTRASGNWPATSIATLRALAISVPTGTRLPI